MCWNPSIASKAMKVLDRMGMENRVGYAEHALPNMAITYHFHDQ